MVFSKTNSTPERVAWIHSTCVRKLGQESSLNATLLECSTGTTERFQDAGDSFFLPAENWSQKATPSSSHPAGRSTTSCGPHE